MKSTANTITTRLTVSHSSRAMLLTLEAGMLGYMVKNVLVQNVDKRKESVRVTDELLLLTSKDYSSLFMWVIPSTFFI